MVKGKLKCYYLSLRITRIFWIVFILYWKSYYYWLFCSLLKICNLNVLTGVVGVFNCQGAGSWSLKSLEAAPSCITISGKVRPLDVEFLEEAAGENWNGDCIVYAFNAGSNYTSSMHHILFYAFLLEPKSLKHIHFSRITKTNYFTILQACFPRCLAEENLKCPWKLSNVKYIQYLQ